MSKCSKLKYAWDIYFPIPKDLSNKIFIHKSVLTIKTLTVLDDPILFFTKYCIEWFAGKCEKKYRICPEDIHVKYVSKGDSRCVAYGPKICCSKNKCDLSNDYLSHPPGAPEFFPDSEYFLYVCFNIKAIRIFLKTPSLYNNYHRSICYNGYSSNCIYHLDIEDKKTKLSRFHTHKPKCPIRGKKSDISYITVCEDNIEDYYKNTNYYFKIGSLNVSSGPFLSQTTDSNKIIYDNKPLSICFLCPHVTKISYEDEICIDFNKPTIYLEVWQNYLALVWKDSGKGCDKKKS